MTHTKPQVAPQVAPGYILINASSATGGVTNERMTIVDDQHGVGRSISFRQVKRIDNATVVREIDAAVKDVDHVLRDLCVRIPNVGHFVTKPVLGEVMQRIAAVAQRVDQLNAKAIQQDSRHRGVARVVQTILDDSETNRQVVYQTVRDLLAELHQALRVGDVVDDIDGDGKIIRRHQLRPILLRARHLDMLVEKPVNQAVRNALERVKTARTALLTTINAGIPPLAAGSALDLTVIETAIARFDD